MSDIKVVEILVGQPAVSRGPVGGSTVPKKPEAKSGDRYVRTRFCQCPPDAPTDCRFHSQTEPGWATCPWEFKPGRSVGRWLWISLGTPVSDEDLSTEANIKELSTADQKAGDRFLR